MQSSPPRLSRTSDDNHLPIQIHGSRKPSARPFENLPLYPPPCPPFPALTPISLCPCPYIPSPHTHLLLRPTVQPLYAPLLRYHTTASLSPSTLLLRIAAPRLLLRRHCHRNIPSAHPLALPVCSLANQARGKNLHPHASRVLLPSIRAVCTQRLPYHLTTCVSTPRKEERPPQP